MSTRLTELLEKGSASAGQGVLAADGARYGWPEMWDLVGRAAGALAAHPPGVIAVADDGSPHTLVAEVAALLGGRDVMPVAAPAGSAVPGVPGARLIGPPGVMSASRAGRHNQARPAGRLLVPDAISGTVTAGVAAASLARAASRLSEATGITSEDVVGSPLPLHDGLGLMCALLAWSAGASLVLADPAASADGPLAWTRLCARRRVTVGAVSPRFLRTAAPAIKDTTEELDLSRIRVLVVGSDPVPPTADELRAFNDAAMECSFDEVALCPSYATGGGTLVWSMTPPDRLWRSRMISEAALAEGRWRTLLTDGGREVVSCGPVLPGAVIRTGRDAPDAVGALLVREADDPGGGWQATNDEGFVAEEVFLT
jgi:hypothetical protein